MTEFEELVITQLVVWRAMKLRSAFHVQNDETEKEVPPDDKFMEDAITELQTLRKFVMSRLRGGE